MISAAQKKVREKFSTNPSATRTALWLAATGASGQWDSTEKEKEIE